jgi:hypothetical protein
MTLHHINDVPKMADNASTIYQSNGIVFAMNYVQLFVLRHRTHSILKTEERKGKLVEKRGRKATGLKLKSQGSRVAENLE